MVRRVLIFSHEYPPCLGGAGTVATTLKEGIGTYDEYEVVVLTSSRTENSKNESVVSVPFSRRLWPFIYFFWLLLNARKFDVIIANDPAAIYTVGKFFPKSYLSNVICFIHGEEKFLTSQSLILRLMGFKGAFNRALSHAKKVIFVSSYIESRYRKLYGIQLPSSKKRIIHSGVSSTQFVKNITVNPLTPYTFLTVSRIEALKGFDVMLNAFLHLREKGFDIKWLIAGQGGYYRDFKRKVEESNLSGNVTFYGRVERTELSRLFNMTNYYLSLSELNESYGLSYLEAASFGVTPVGYNRCGTKEAFQYIQGGYLIESYKNPLGVACELEKIIASFQSNSIVRCERTVEQFCLEVIDEL